MFDPSSKQGRVWHWSKYKNPLLVKRIMAAIETSNIYVKFCFKTTLRDRDLNKVRVDRVRLLLDDIHGNVDEDGENKLRDEMKILDERWLHVETRYRDVVKEEPSAVSSCSYVLVNNAQPLPPYGLFI